LANLPKWLGDLHDHEREQSPNVQIDDAKTGKPDVIFEGRKLRDLSHDATTVTTSFSNTLHPRNVTHQRHSTFDNPPTQEQRTWDL